MRTKALIFDSIAAARTQRAKQPGGGPIFEKERTGEALLFPAGTSVPQIFADPEVGGAHEDGRVEEG